MRTTTRLRQLLNARRTIVAPGCYNALSAKILDTVGFPALYMTGYGTSLSLLGMPDAGLCTMTEMHVNARYIANAVKVPVIADADNGYGNAINVIRTVREYVQTGVAAIHLEDQIIPKRCGHVAGRRVVPVEEARKLERLLKDKGQPCEIKVYPGQGHDFDAATTRDAGQRTKEFLDRRLKGNTVP